jgi:serine/threonine protein kinase
MKVNASHISKEQKFVFVRTFCQANLRSVIFNDKSVTPAQASSSNINQAIDAFFKWAIEIADGLNYIHERGLIHRHLKLENILVCINLTFSLAIVNFHSL